MVLCRDIVAVVEVIINHVIIIIIIIIRAEKSVQSLGLTPGRPVLCSLQVQGYLLLPPRPDRFRGQPEPPLQ